MIESIDNFLEAVRKDSSSWHPKEPIWFRGEPKSNEALLPTLYRKGLAQYENVLLQMFRSKASVYHEVVPERADTDQWLFLARHFGLPTRLLDWSEGALIALHFALENEEPVIWMLNPLELNDLACNEHHTDPNKMREFPLVWFEPPLPRVNPALENLCGAWELDRRGVPLPVAVYPTYVHSRLRAQRSCFTIHGKEKRGLDSLVPDNILKRYVVNPKYRQSMANELRLLGVTHSVVFLDLVGLVQELETQFL